MVRAELPAGRLAQWALHNRQVESQTLSAAKVSGTPCCLQEATTKEGEETLLFPWARSWSP